MKFILFYFLLCYTVVGAQNSQVFMPHKEFYVRGSTTVVGNNILSKDAQKPFDNPDKVNDQIKMKYVDIDTDASTWSSSSAYLDLDPTATVLYAALYWSGTYYGDRTMKRIKYDRVYHKLLEERSKDIKEVKIKGPGGEYVEILGTQIYDSGKALDLNVRKRAPYACMADVTKIVQGQKAGYFTVANVSATQGEIIGGSSAGWLLYVVYEDKTEPLQYITTYHGFEFINKKPVQIDFANFSTADAGQVEASVTIGALEGDSNLGRDEVAIFDVNDMLYVTLDNKVRASSNFFNSTITLNDSLYTKRIPQSMNTLGFDIAKIKIPNAQNTLIGNSTTGVRMQYKTRSDRFFVFFTAFQATISEQNYQENQKKKVTITKTPASQALAETGYLQPKPVVVHQRVEIAKPEPPAENSSDAPVFIPTQVVDKELNKLLNKPSVSIENVGRGYYIINNVFSNIKNAEKWITTLKSKDLSPQYFLRPSNNLYYVFLDASTDAVQIKNKLENYSKQDTLKNSWILKVNL